MILKPTAPERDSRKEKPPGWIESLLGRLLPHGIVGDSIIGDLREEFSLETRTFSPLQAKIRYLRKALSLGLRFSIPFRPNPGKQSRRGRSPGGTMSAFFHDMRQALRLLVRRPGLALAATLSLGLGIGANTAIFSLVNTILLKPLPYPDSQELVEAFRIDEDVTGLNPTPGRISGLWAVPYEVHKDWLEMDGVFQAGGGYAGTRIALQEGDASSSILALRMTSGAFRALRAQPILGRTFLPSDDEVGAPPVVVLGYGLWQSQFGGDPEILDTEITLSDVAHTVVGVMGQGFAFPSDSYRIWTSFSDDQKTSPTRNSGYMKVLARLSPGVSLDDARRDMDRVSARIGELHPEEAEHRIGLFPQKEMILGDSGTGLLVLLGAVILVLLIACTNIAGLFLVRATEKRREIGVRRALGAGRDRLIFQQMWESLLLSILGGAAGLLLAVVGLEPLLSLMPGELPRIHEMSVDQSFLFTALGFALVTGILTGVLPALRAAGTPITTVLREGGRGFAGARSRNRTQSVLVVSQIALAFVLLTGAGLVIRSLAGLLAVGPGFDTDNLALANVSFPAGTEDAVQAQVYFRELEDRIRAMPGVMDVGAANQMPFSGGWSAPPVTIQTPEGEWDGILHMPTVTPSYFSTMGIPVLSGRGLSLDDTAESEPVVVVSQALANRMIQDGGSPLGSRIRLNAGEGSVWRVVVGVVGDVKYRLDFDDMIMAYIPAVQNPNHLGNWVIRTASDPLALAPVFQQLREELDPEGTSQFRALADIIEGSTAVVSARFSVILLGGLAALAAILAVLGVYGVLAYLVQLRSRELGIQLALGAEEKTVLGTVLRRGLLMGILGLGAGLLLSLAFGRVMESQLFGIEPWDPAALTGAGILLVGATLAASYLPARRAAGLDPVEVLKGE
ncbi:MAG: ABC transporter permease [Gemmatimonadota bacterium]|jgi:predicted permease